MPTRCGAFPMPPRSGAFRMPPRSGAFRMNMPELSVPVRCGLWMALMSVGFAVQVSMVRLLSEHLHVIEIAFWRNSVGLIAFLPWVFKVGLGGLKTARLGLYLTRSAILVFSSTTLVFAVVFMPLAEVTALTFSQGLFATLLAVVILKEVVDRGRWLSLLLGVIGVLVILRPGAAAFQPAAILALASSFAFACIIITGKLLLTTEPPARVSVYLWLLGAPLTLIPASFVWQWPEGEAWLWILALGLGASANLYGTTRALNIGDASLTAPFDFMRLPVAALFAFLLFAQVPDTWTWIGSAIIFASVIFLARRESREAQKDPALRSDGQ